MYMEFRKMVTLFVLKSILSDSSIAASVSFHFHLHGLSFSIPSLSLFTFMHWRRKWQPTPVFLPGESQGWGSLVGCHLWGRTESKKLFYTSVSVLLSPIQGYHYHLSKIFSYSYTTCIDLSFEIFFKFIYFN